MSEDRKSSSMKKTRSHRKLDKTGSSLKKHSSKKSVKEIEHGTGASPGTQPSSPTPPTVSFDEAAGHPSFTEPSGTSTRRHHKKRSEDGGKKKIRDELESANARIAQLQASLDSALQTTTLMASASAGETALLRSELERLKKQLEEGGNKAAFDELEALRKENATLKEGGSDAVIATLRSELKMAQLEIASLNDMSKGGSRQSVDLSASQRAAEAASKLRSAQAHNAELEKKLSAAIQDKKDLDQLVPKLKLEIAGLQGSLSEITNRNDHLERQKTADDAKIAELSSEKSALIAQGEAYQAEISGLKATVSSLENHRDTLQAKVDADASLIHNFTSDKSGLQATLAARDSEIVSLKASIKTLETAVESLTSTKAETDIRNSGLLAEKATLLGEIDGLKAERSALQTDKSGLQSEVSTLTTNLEAVTTEKNTLIEERAAEKARLLERIAELEQLLAAEQAKTGSLTSSLETAGNEKTGLIAEIERLNASLAQVSADLKRYQDQEQADLDAIIDEETSSRILRTKLRRAEAEVKRLKKDNAQLEDARSDLIKDIDTLRRTISTGTLLANADTSKAETNKLNDEIARLTRQLNDAAEDKKLLEERLHRAKTLADRLAGGEDQFEIKKEKIQLEKQVRELKQKLKDALYGAGGDASSKLADEHEALRTKYEELNASYTTLQARVKELEEAAAVSKARLSQMTLATDTLESDLATARGEISKLSSGALLSAGAADNEEVERLREQNTELRATVASLKAASSASGASPAGSSDEIKKLQGKIRVLEQEKEDLEDDVKIQKKIAEGLRAKAAAAADSSHLQDQLDAAQAAVRTAERSLKAVTQEKEDLQEELAQAQKKIAELSASGAGNSGALEEARAASAAAVERATDLESQLKKLTKKCQDLENRLAEVSNSSPAAGGDEVDEETAVRRLNAKIRSLERQIQQLEEDKSTLEDDLEMQKELVETFRTASAGSSSSSSEAATELNSLRDQHAKVQRELKDALEDKKSLEERLERAKQQINRLADGDDSDSGALKKEAEKLKAEVKTLKAQLREASASASSSGEVEAVRAELAAKTTSYEQQIAALTEKLAQSQAQVAAAGAAVSEDEEGEARRLRSKVTRLESKIEQLEEDKQDLEESLKLNKELIETLQGGGQSAGGSDADAQALKEELTAVKSQLSQAERALREATEDKQSLEERLTRAKDQLARLTEESGAGAGNHTELQALNEKLTAEVASLKSQVELAASSSSSRSDEVEGDLRAQIATLEKKITTLQADIESRNQAETTDASDADPDATIRVLKSKVIRLERQIEELTEDKTSLEDDLQFQKELVETLQSGGASSGGDSSALKAELTKAQDELTKAQRALREVTEDKNSLEERFNRAKAQIARLSEGESDDTAKKEVQKLKEEVRKLKNQLRVAEAGGVSSSSSSNSGPDVSELQATVASLTKAKEELEARLANASTQSSSSSSTTTATTGSNDDAADLQSKLAESQSTIARLRRELEMAQTALEGSGTERSQLASLRRKHQEEVDRLGEEIETLGNQHRTAARATREQIRKLEADLDDEKAKSSNLQRQLDRLKK